MLIDIDNNLIFGVPPYMFFAGVGFIVAFGVLVWLSIKSELYIRMSICVCSVIGIYIGARCFGVLTNICNSLYSGTPLSLQIFKEAGLVFYGGLLGYISFSIVGMKLILKEIDWGLLNIMAIPIPIFHCIARVGCLIAGCCYGRNYDGILAVTYKNADDLVNRFPVQIMEAMIEFFIFGGIMYLFRKGKTKRYLLTYLFLYAWARIFTELFRGDSIRGFFNFISFSQIISVIIIMIASACFIKNKQRKKV